MKYEFLLALVALIVFPGNDVVVMHIKHHSGLLVNAGIHEGTRTSCVGTFEMVLEKMPRHPEKESMAVVGFNLV